MSKSLIEKNLGKSTLAAVSLVLTIAAFGCTTDRNLGNGDPVTTPGLRSIQTGCTSDG
jgi:hypothetical protein